MEHEVRVRCKELREQEFQHDKEVREKDRENKEMKNDIEKLLKLISRLKKRTKVCHLSVLVSLVMCCERFAP